MDERGVPSLVDMRHDLIANAAGGNVSKAMPKFLQRGKKPASKPLPPKTDMWGDPVKAAPVVRGPKKPTKSEMDQKYLDRKNRQIWDLNHKMREQKYARYQKTGSWD